jgi:REP element-mobilizing transposase RayT
LQQPTPVARVYHVMGRGDRREPIYGDDQDRLLFLDTLAEACEKTDWQVHAWCLMSNHFHLVSETPRGNLVTRMEARRRAEGTGEYEPRGWCLGSEEFRQELLEQVSRMATPKDGGEEVRQSALAKTRRMAQEELDALGWAAQELQGRRKSDPQKVRIASRLRRETTMTLEWIAGRLCMGAATHVAFLLQRHNQNGPSSEETLF